MAWGHVIIRLVALMPWQGAHGIPSRRPPRLHVMPQQPALDLLPEAVPAPSNNISVGQDLACWLFNSTDQSAAGCDSGPLPTSAALHDLTVRGIAPVSPDA